MQREARSSGATPLILTTAVYYAPNVNRVNHPIQAIAKSLDWINLMAYDFSGPTRSTVTNSPAALYDPSSQVSGSYGIRAWIQASLSANKLVFRIPFYGYAWHLMNANNHGLLAPANGPVGSTDGSMRYQQITKFIT
ncbi:hypothetical protein F0562_010733 [Nyssa sinensis]|uniref:GH18 domain-containing protein n=1 Tax=Nyssa sinensis TaxID=561372 RepID=A0A5J5A1I8_9ASTE|nr:hypothetical protein F0562_010733 [Nyssa sinensis]